MKDRLTVKVTAETVYRRKILIRISLLVLIGLLLLTTTVYSVIYVVNQSGNFTINLDPNLQRTSKILMSPHKDFHKTEITLSARALDYMDNISELWLPEDLDAREGENSEDNYIAYSFFIKNAGTLAIDYNAMINIQSVIKGVDEAVRVAVYRNGEKTVYAKVNKVTKQPEPKTTAFLSNTKVMSQKRENFEPGVIDKYTVIIWLEGDDPECIDNILGGEMKMMMLINQTKEYNE